MKFVSGLIVFTAILLQPLPSNAQTELGASIDRAQEVPPIPTAAGSATFSTNGDGTELTYEIQVWGIPGVAAAHFHNAAMGENGGVVRELLGDFEDDAWVSAGVWSSDEADQPMTSDLVDELNAGNIYINVHTADYGPGEIRGQILDMSAELGRDQQVPPIPAAAGLAALMLNDDGTELAYEIRVWGIPAVAAAHFHNAPMGENGGVVRELAGEIEEDMWVSAGVWSSDEADQPLSADLVDELMAGNIYINVHTADYGPGEVRGQILLSGATAVENESWGSVKAEVDKHRK